MKALLEFGATRRIGGKGPGSGQFSEALRARILQLLEERHHG